MENSLSIYLAIVLFTALQRSYELVISRRHEESLNKKGAIEIGHGHFIYMKILHILWPIACLIEAYTKREAPTVAFAAFFFLLFAIGQLLRIMAIKTLGERWSVKILVIPGAAPVTKGIFRYLRHPNYLGVVLEIFALPLIYGGWVTAIVFTILNAILLKVRIKREERALDEAGNYLNHFSNHNRFIPKGSAHV